MLFKQFQTKNWKSRKLLSFFGAFCSCFGEKVLSVELKIFLCCIKTQKQRYFRELTKRWAFFNNLQPFELGRIFRIKRNRSTIFFAQMGKKTWSRQASLHGTQCRFMQRKLRFIFCGSAAKCFINTPWQMKHCFRLHFITPRQAAKAPQYEAASFHSAMKHSLRSYY